MILIDIPVVAYKTWAIEITNIYEDGHREINAEAEDDIKEMLMRSGYVYSSDHRHVR